MTAERNAFDRAMALLVSRLARYEPRTAASVELRMVGGDWEGLESFLMMSELGDIGAGTRDFTDDKRALYDARANNGDGQYAIALAIRDLSNCVEQTFGLGLTDHPTAEARPLEAIAMALRDLVAGRAA